MDDAENKKASRGNPPAAFGQRGDSGGSSNRLTQKSPGSASPAASPTGKNRRRRSPEISIQIAEEDTKIVTTAAMTSDSPQEDTPACINVLNYNENFRSATANQESPSATPNFKPFNGLRNIKSDSHIIGKGVSVDEVEGEQDNN